MKLQLKEATRTCLQKPLNVAQSQNEVDRPKINRNNYLHQFVSLGDNDKRKGKPIIKKQRHKTVQVNSNPPSSPWTTFQKQQGLMGNRPIQSVPYYYNIPFRTPTANAIWTNSHHYQSDPMYSIRLKRDGGKDISSSLDNLQSDILSKLSNITCILMETGILKPDMSINVEGQLQEYNDVSIILLK